MVLVICVLHARASLVAWAEESACSAVVRSLGWEDPTGEGNGCLSSILVWRIPEEPGGGQSVGSQRVRHDRETDTAITVCYDRRTRISKYHSKILKYF